MNGYRIGSYPSTPLKGKPIYLPPRGFIEVTKENQDTKVSPHFTLKQFLCKEETTRAFPKYVVLYERLPLKLEAVLARVNQLGVKVDTLNVDERVPHPYYNHAIGDVKSGVPPVGQRGRHLRRSGQEGSDAGLESRRKGGHPGREGPLRRNRADALGERAPQARGRLGYYPATSAHPPFVHVDVRGTTARWKG